MNEVYRQEKKYFMSLTDMQRLMGLLDQVMIQDPHNGARGYAIRSLYFDSLDDRDYGAESTTKNLLAMIDALPAGAHWSAFGLGRDEFPMVAQAMLNGGNVRVGLEDNIYLDKGVFATNEGLVSKAVDLVERLGGRVLTPAEAREVWGLSSR